MDALHEVVPVDGTDGPSTVAHVLLRDGAVAGFALLTNHEPAHVEAAWRTVDGHVGCHRGSLSDGPADPLGGWWQRTGPACGTWPGDFAALVNDANAFVAAGVRTRSGLVGASPSVRTLGRSVFRGGSRRSDASDRWHLADALLEDVGTAFSAFLGTLDPGALAYVGGIVDARRADRALVSAHGSDYDLSAVWDGLDATFVPGAPLRRAIHARPGLRRVLTQAWRDDAPGFRDRMSASQVDEVVGWALTTCGYDVPGRTVIRADDALTRLTTEPGTVAVTRTAATQSADAALELGWHLRHLPPSWVPSTDPEWGAFAALVALREDGHLLRITLGGMSELASIFASGGRWAGFRDRVARAAARDWEDVPAACMDVSDFVQAFVRQVVDPLVVAAGRDVPHDVANRGVGLALLCRGRSLPRLLEASRAWHARRAAIDAVVASLAGPGGDASWPAAFPGASRGGRDLVVLTTEARLVDEGATGLASDGSEGLSHCVGGYGRACLRGDLRILSLRVPAPGPTLRTSTAAIGLRCGVPVVLQHRAVRNAPPSDGDVAALAIYVADLRSGALAFDPGALAPLPEPPRGACYDASVPGAAGAVLAAWRPVLPRRLRRLDVAGMTEAILRE